MEKPTSSPQRPTLSTGPINWEKLSTQLENGTNLKISLKSRNEIEAAAQNLVSMIQTAVRNSCL